MNMTDGDIAASFRQAKDPKKQVQVLADLNVVSRREMEEKLHQLGLAAKPKPRPEKRCHTRPPDFDELLAMELYNEGKSDLDIAEQLGVAKWKFGEWRRDRALPANQKVSEKKETPPPEPKKKAGASCQPKPPMPPEVETPEPVPAQETAGDGSQSTVAAVETKISAGRLGQTLMDLEKRYPGLTITVNGAAVRSLCLNVRVMLNGTEDMYSTLDLEVG